MNPMWRLFPSLLHKHDHSLARMLITVVRREVPNIVAKNNVKANADVVEAEATFLGLWLFILAAGNGRDGVGLTESVSEQLCEELLFSVIFRPNGNERLGLPNIYAQHSYGEHCRQLWGIIKSRVQTYSKAFAVDEKRISDGKFSWGFREISREIEKAFFDGTAPEYLKYCQLAAFEIQLCVMELYSCAVQRFRKPSLLRSIPAWVLPSRDGFWIPREVIRKLVPKP